MADSFGADLMVGLLSVPEAGPKARFVMRLDEYFSPVALLVAVVCSMCKNPSIARRSSIEKQTRQRRSRYQGRKKLRLMQNRLGMA
ncbi:hypothetical protein [Pseudomonas aeruginosa]|uniref:hypothetical protein n=1 Tax=Pseudomonas aeruginosa TaxID=287 RepID=UPI001AAF819D|nr:hypothetical protein [Pseudomonas aeruginosa]MBO2859713.1 hypothetical protein [Pseudomonas aeruginosa]MBO2937370.1 hypothetical protein [Pseudomonas aeruginosa]MDV7805811.1 hypothetical protein [Pseudomonas aeruginosa]